MNAAWLILLLPMAATSGWWFANRRGQQQSQESEALNQSFLFGINQLLAIEDDDALKAFLDTMGDQPKSVELQMVLGSLCRRKGEYERASLIHQTILNSATHQSETRQQAQFELAQDYQAAGWLDRSESLYLELLSSSRFRTDTATSLLRIYQHEKDWASAVQMANLLREHDPASKQLSEQLAHLNCELCEQRISEGKFPEAESYLKEAENIEPANPRVIILLGRIASFKGEHKKALQFWRKLELVAPSLLGLAIPHIQDSFHVLNDREGYLAFLKRAAHSTQSPEVLAALLESMQTESPQNANQFLLQYLQDRPNIEGLKQILQNWKEAPAQISREDLLFLVETTMSLVQGENLYQCGECGFKAMNFEWACPGCHSWGKYKRNILSLPAQARAEHEPAVTAQPLLQRAGRASQSS